MMSTHIVDGEVQFAAFGMLSGFPYAGIFFYYKQLHQLQLLQQLQLFQSLLLSL